MNNIFNPDFQDFIKALNNNKVEYILVGGYAVILHGYSRNTGDMDIWVRRTKGNYAKIQLAFHEFKMPLFDMTEENFLLSDKIDVFSFGVPPVSIDLMTDAKGLNFDEAFSNSSLHNIEGLKVRVIHLNDLIKQKKAVNRTKDQNDIENLQSRKK